VAQPIGGDTLPPMNQISAVMIVKNGAKTLEKALDSLREFSEVVVFDNGSTDASQEIARRYPNVQLHEGQFEGFGPTKNKAASLAKHDWVLIVDSDEALDPTLAKAILETQLEPRTVYLLDRKAYYKDYEVKHCGWGNEKIRRLYNRKETSFTENHVHENVIVQDLNVREITGGSILHYTYQTISEFIQKVDHYSSLYAENNKGKKRASPAKAIINGLYSFFRTYVIKRGFLDGYVGLVIAFSHMATNFYKYMKLYEANKLLEKGTKG
jgi:glycosyltransferase involved in cell wall biosynthesis